MKEMGNLRVVPAHNKDQDQKHYKADTDDHDKGHEPNRSVVFVAGLTALVDKVEILLATCTQSRAPFVSRLTPKRVLWLQHNPVLCRIYHVGVRNARRIIVD